MFLMRSTSTCNNYENFHNNEVWIDVKYANLKVLQEKSKHTLPHA